MSRSYRNSPMEPTVTKIKRRKKRCEMSEFHEYEERENYKEWVKEQKLLDYLKGKGEIL